MQLAQVFIAVGFNRRMPKKQDLALAEFHYTQRLILYPGKIHSLPNSCNSP